jgi:hypothetical protein
MHAHKMPEDRLLNRRSFIDKAMLSWKRDQFGVLEKGRLH